MAQCDKLHQPLTDSNMSVLLILRSARKDSCWPILACIDDTCSFNLRRFMKLTPSSYPVSLEQLKYNSMRIENVSLRPTFSLTVGIRPIRVAIGGIFNFPRAKN